MKLALNKLGGGRESSIQRAGQEPGERKEGFGKQRPKEEQKMILNHIEILTAKWLEYQGYLTQGRIPFWLPKEKTGKKQSQWSDMDILAINQDEVKFVECKAFLGTTSKEVVAERIKEHFEIGSEQIIKNYPWLKNKNRSFLVVAEAPSNLESCRTLLRDDEIRLKHFKDIIEGVLSHLRKKLPPDKYMSAIAYGIKEEENMCRLLLSLLSYGFLERRSSSLGIIRELKRGGIEGIIPLFSLANLKAKPESK